MNEKDIEIKKLQEKVRKYIYHTKIDRFTDLGEKLTSLANLMSTFEGTMKERDKAHAAEIELERKKQEELAALVVTLQQNRHEIQQRHEKIRNESVNRPSAQRDELITDAGEAAMNSEDDTIPKDTRPFQLAKDTEMQDNSSMVDSKWQIRSGNGPYISDSDGDNLEFYLDENDEMNLVVRELYFQLEINYIS